MLARQNGVRFENLDRLVGSVMLFEQATDDGAGLLIETFPDGWWYTAALPDDRRIVAAMSDADLVRSLELNRPDGFVRALGATQHVCRAVADARPIGSPVLRPAGSRHIVARYDAAAAVRRRRGLVLRSGVGAGPVQGAAVGDLRRVCDRRFPVPRRIATGVERYRRFVADEFAGYRETLREYYAMERRWADRPFWKRRIADDARTSSAAPTEAALPV